jgi:glycogen debranching enzyme
VTPASDVHLVDGATFCVAPSTGNLATAHDGVYVFDTRIVARLVLKMNGTPLEAQSVESPDPRTATFKVALAPGVCLERIRTLGQHGVEERLVLSNQNEKPLSGRLTLELTTDLADIFEVRGEGTSRRPPPPTVDLGDTGAVIQRTLADSNVQRVDLAWPRHWHALRRPGGVTLEADLATPLDNASEAVVSARWAGHDDRPEQRKTTTAPDRGERRRPVCSSPRLQRTLDRCLDDLSALELHEPAIGPGPVIAAGAPWFMTLFGRDSLLAALMLLDVRPDCAVATVRTLARWQGTLFNAVSEEQPGRIPHEVRLGRSDPGWLARPCYYGTADATPLFLVLLDELDQRGLAPAVIEELMPAADAAVDWILRIADEGDGYIAYPTRSGPGRLHQQGWRDSDDGVCHRDGRIAAGAVATADVQACAFRGLRARAALAARRADADTANRLDWRADRLKERFNDEFWLPHLGWYATALADGQRVESLTSAIGHCLWAGLVDEARAVTVADHLLGDRLFSGWGVRTLSTDNPAYRPDGYHTGSVWPHDTAITVAGLARYGLTDHARRLANALLDALTAFDGRPPELMAGTPRQPGAGPDPLPSACSPQAWAAAAPFLVIRAMNELGESEALSTCFQKAT